jgi:PAS domain S-box-containing protein
VVKKSKRKVVRVAKINSQNTSRIRSWVEQQAESEALFNSIGDGSIATDEFGHITRVNPVAAELLGFEESELLGEWYPKKVIAQNAEGEAINLIDRPITKAFLTGRSISEKIYFCRKDGGHFPAAVNVSPIVLDGKPLGAIEVFRDISLEEEIDRMKSEFISLASHQLRTPLSAIKTYAHMLVDGYMGNITENQNRALSTIISATNRMNELISTLLNITRFESGSIAVSPKSLQVDKFAADVIKELDLLATEKSIKVSLKRSGSGGVTVISDVLVLREILTNLISNAIKYTPDSGKVTVTVQGRANDVLIKVSDTGWGIPKHAQDQIFSKFFRAPNIIKRETTGTGLGLYLVKGLIDAIDGKIWFKSEEGEGTTFYVSLPRQQTIIKKPLLQT